MQQVPPAGAIGVSGQREVPVKILENTRRSRECLNVPDGKVESGAPLLLGLAAVIAFQRIGGRGVTLQRGGAEMASHAYVLAVSLRLIRRDQAWNHAGFEALRRCLGASARWPGAPPAAN